MRKTIGRIMIFVMLITILLSGFSTIIWMFVK